MSFVMDESPSLEPLLQKLKAQSPQEVEAIRREFDRLQGDLKVTDERLDQTARELAKVNSSLKEMEKKRNEMLSICAHDLKSPTSSILSFIDILKSNQHRLGEQEVSKVYDRMERAGRHMWNLVNDLLDTHQIETGKVKLEKQPLLLSQLAREVCNHVEAKANSKEISLSVDVKPAELKVSLDIQKGIQIITNLVSNALKFTPRGGNIQLRVFTEGQRTALEVQDSGQGIPADELDKIFQKFKQTSTRATEGEKGSGLGLSIVQQLVELHDGEISVRSKLNQGTIFSLVFPIAESSVLLKLFSGKK